MRGVELVLAVGWGAFWLYWLVAAVFMKSGHVEWWRELGSKGVIAALAILLVHLGAFQVQNSNGGWWLTGLGLVIFASGLAFAIWARVHLGRNWGTPMTQKVEPELVIGGPYHLVRHPIYTGVVLAGIGTAVALGWRWLVAVALVAVYFLYSAIVEERYMVERFPEAYPEYRRSTKMFVPFVF